MNQWMQKEPIRGADLKEADGGGGDVCASQCVCVFGSHVCVCIGGKGGNIVFFSC